MREYIEREVEDFINRPAGHSFPPFPIFNYTNLIHIETPGEKGKEEMEKRESGKRRKRTEP